MSTKVRLTSLFLAVLMFVSVLHAFPPVQVSAASAPTATMTVGKSTLELGSSTSYSGTAKGNGHTFSTVTLGIAYYPTEDDYDDGAAANWVYKRNTNLSASSKTLSGTFKTSSGSYVTGTNNDGTGSRKLYTDKVGFYTITIAAYAASYGSAVQKTKTIEVVEPEEEFDVSKDELEFDSASASKTFKVYASSAYTITKNVSWITLSSTSGSSDKTITVTCKENTSTSPREGTIQVKHTSTGKTYTIDVYQDGKEVYATITNFAISSSTLSSNGSISFSGVINGNGEKITAVQVNIFNKTTHDLGGTFFRAENLNVSTYDLSKVTAITSDVITGSGAYELKLEPGKSYDIVVYAKLSNGNGFENEVLKTFSVIEDLKISTDELEFDADGGKESFVVTASNSFSISESLSWITLSSTSGSSTKTISVTCAENTSNSPREGTIKVKHTSTGKTYTINVYQDGKKVYATITNFAISSSTLSSNGSISFSGVINGNGEKITAVQVNIFNKTTHDLGGTFFRAENLNVSTYDLSKVTAITSDVITGSGAYELKLEPGKSYDIVVYAKLSNGNGFENEVLKTFSVEQNTSPAVNSITASGSYMTYTFTVTCNKYATNGIVLYADEHEMKDISWTKKASGDTVTYTGKFSFSLDGTRTITAYALDSKGNRITDSSKSTTVNVNSKGRVPAPKIKTANPSTIKIGDTLYLTWEKPTANLTYTYNVYVLRNGTNVCVNSSKITGTSYTIPASYFPQEGEYIVSVIAMAENYTQSDDDLASINVNVVKTISTTVGDVNGDGQVTNKDRFVLNRYLAGMAGYENINKNLADINGDGKVTRADADILLRHLAAWEGYYDLSVFYKPTSQPSSPAKWEMSFSANSLYIDLKVKAGEINQNTVYQFIAENSQGKHYWKNIEMGKTAATFKITSMKLPRGQYYTFYVIPQGISLDDSNRSEYSLGKFAVPLYSGNMITSVISDSKSCHQGDRVYNNHDLVINWDGSYGVESFELTIELNGRYIRKSFSHSGPGQVVVTAAQLQGMGEGQLVITGKVTSPHTEQEATSKFTLTVSNAPQKVSPIVEEIKSKYLSRDLLFTKNINLARDEFIEYGDSELRLAIAVTADMICNISDVYKYRDFDTYQATHSLKHILDAMDSEYYTNMATSYASFLQVSSELVEYFKETNDADFKSMFGSSKYYSQLLTIRNWFRTHKLSTDKDQSREYLTQVYNICKSDTEMLRKFAQIYANGADMPKINEAVDKFKSALEIAVEEVWDDEENETHKIIREKFDEYLGKIELVAQIGEIFYDIGFKDYLVISEKLNVLIPSLELGDNKELLKAAKYMKTCIDDSVTGTINRIAEGAVDIGSGLIFGGIEEVLKKFTSDIASKGDAMIALCDVFETIYDIDDYMNILMDEYTNNPDSKTFHEMRKTMHALADCLALCNELAAELNKLWFIRYDKYDELMQNSDYYESCHNSIDALFDKYATN